MNSEYKQFIIKMHKILFLNQIIHKNNHNNSNNKNE